MSLALYSQHYSLAGRTIVLLGGASATGTAVAEAVARAGADLIVGGRSPARGHACVEKVRSCGGVGGYAPVDLSKPSSIPPLVDYALGEYGKIDGLVQIASPTWLPQWLLAAGEAFAVAMQQQDLAGTVLSIVPSQSLSPQISGAAEASPVPWHTLIAPQLGDDSSAENLPAVIAMTLALLRHGAQLSSSRLTILSHQQTSD